MWIQTKIAVFGYMLTAICTIIMMVGTAAPCLAQTEAKVDTIRIRHKHSSCEYYHGVYKVGSSNLREIMIDCPEAISRLSKADACRATSSFLMVASGACIGMSLASAFRTGWDNETATMVAGVALAAISFDLDQRVYKHRNTAVKIFNNKQLMRSEKPSTTIKLAFTGQGVGLVVSF